MIYYAICIVIYAIALCVGDINIKWKSWVNIEEYICIIIAGSILFINILNGASYVLTKFTDFCSGC